jgi:carotenoid cleavage dioxygenase-like enzyme
MKKGLKAVQWFELPNHYVFHFVNSWDEGNTIKMFGLVHNNLKMEFTREHPFLAENFDSYLYKFEFNLDTGVAKMTKLIEECLEFASINLDFTGYKNRFAYLPFMADTVGTGQDASENVFL